MDWITLWILVVWAVIAAALLIISYAITKIIVFHMEHKKKGGKNENKRSSAKPRR